MLSPWATAADDTLDTFAGYAVDDTPRLPVAVAAVAFVSDAAAESVLALEAVSVDAIDSAVVVAEAVAMRSQFLKKPICQAWIGSIHVPSCRALNGRTTALLAGWASSTGRSTGSGQSINIIGCSNERPMTTKDEKRSTDAIWKKTREDKDTREVVREVLRGIRKSPPPSRHSCVLVLEEYSVGRAQSRSAGQPYETLTIPCC